MRQFEMKSSYGGASQEILSGLEQRLGIRLPDDYKTFLLTHNGGEPLKDLFNVPEWGESIITEFLGVGLGDYRDLERAAERISGIFDLKTLFPISHDPGGNRIMLAVDGRVFFSDHEESADELIELAPSFYVFFSNLKQNEA